MKKRCKELPDELWESILNCLTIDDDYGDLQSPSLVCKQFLTITNRLRRKLVARSDVFNRNKCEILSRALDRFKNLKEMELVGLYPESDVDYLVMKIAFSALDIQSLCFRCFPISPSAVTFSILGSTMKNLKVLRCREFGSLQDTDLVHIADAFPTLEELDIRYPIFSRQGLSQDVCLYPCMVTDAGIEAISCKLRELRRIYICGNPNCSDRSLIALSSNCMLLNEIACSACDISRRGIEWALCHSTNLTYLKTGGFYHSSRNSNFKFDDLEIHATGLRELDIVGDDDSERLLCSIAKAGIPLEKLKLICPSGFDINGVTTLLGACSTLKHFQGECGFRFDDNAMRDLCRCLPNIVSINVHNSITATTFSVLAKECPVLSEITVHIEPSEQSQDDFVMNLERNSKIRYLDLSYSWKLNDKLLKDIVVTCPNLHTLKVEGCAYLTQEGLKEILKSCPQIKHLKFDRICEGPFRTFKTRQIKIEFD